MPPLIPHSSVSGVAWPALPGAGGSALLALLFQYEQTQWWPPERLREQQFRQLHALLSHAAATVPFYRERLAAAGFDAARPLTEEVWRRLPLLQRAEIQRAGAALQSSALPAGHGTPVARTTSGSTGRPLSVLRTAVDGLYWQAHTLRDHLWHRRDFRGTLAVIRAQGAGKAAWPKGAKLANWGPSTAAVYRTGPALVLNADTPVDRQLEWLARGNPHYLLALPSLLGELARLALAQGVALPRLRGAASLGGILAPSARAACRAAWNVGIADTYSAQEIGYVALQCPDEEHFHVVAESVLVEVLDDEGEPCRPGAFGRVVVTPLHNFAMPLIRYVIGDYAEVGSPCSCGRGLPVLARVVGRVRNLLTLPSGQRISPTFVNSCFDGLPVAQFHVVQTALDRLDMRIAPTRPFTPEDEERVVESVNAQLGAALQIGFTYVDSIPRGPGGKYEDFRSEVGTT